MPLADLPLTDTRRLFRPVAQELVALLRGLQIADWERPTVAGAWLVRDVVAHMADGAMRRLSFHRDRLTPPSPGASGSDREFVAFINGLNQQWVTVARRFSPRVLTDLFEVASTGIADWFESLPLEAPALFPVSWAGEEASAGWFDVGREFTELWHHQQQVRIAVGAPSLADTRYLHAVLEIAVRGLPHAFRELQAEPGTSVVVDVTGPAGGQWTLTRGAQDWRLSTGELPVPSARVSLSDDAGWKLLFNALSEAEAATAIHVVGRTELVRPLLRARSVVV